jgi:hypothetical protein
MAPSASFMAQKRKKAMALRLTSTLCGLLVKAMRQLTQSVKVVTCREMGQGHQLSAIGSVNVCQAAEKSSQISILRLRPG